METERKNGSGNGNLQNGNGNGMMFSGGTGAETEFFVSVNMELSVLNMSTWLFCSPTNTQIGPTHDEQNGPDGPTSTVLLLHQAW